MTPPVRHHPSVPIKTPARRPPHRSASLAALQTVSSPPRLCPSSHQAALRAPDFPASPRHSCSSASTSHQGTAGRRGQRPRITRRPSGAAPSDHTPHQFPSSRVASALVLVCCETTPAHCTQFIGQCRPSAASSKLGFSKSHLEPPFITRLFSPCLSDRPQAEYLKEQTPAAAAIQHVRKRSAGCSRDLAKHRAPIHDP